MTERIKSFFFSILQPTEKEWLTFEKQLKTKKWKAGETVLSEGQVCTDIFFINKGAMRLYYLKNDEEVNTYFAFEGKLMFNYESFLTRKPMKYYIQALEDTEAFVISYDVIQKETDKFYNWKQLGLIITEQSYLQLVQRVESFLFMTAEERYLDLIKTYPNIFERVPLYHIASYLGITGPSLSRIRKNIVKS
jgi:CRP/FNR family transcriptional regulator